MTGRRGGSSAGRPHPFLGRRPPLSSRLPSLPPEVTAAGVDPGLQPERTSLARTRTWLLMVTVSAIFLRWIEHYGLWMLLLPGATLTAAVIMAARQRVRLHRGVRSIHGEEVPSDPMRLLVLVALMLLLGGVGCWLVLGSD